MPTDPGPPARILHAVDTGGASPALLAYMRRWIESGGKSDAFALGIRTAGAQAVLLIGGEGLARDAAAAGLVAHRRVAFPLGQPLLAPTAGRQAFRGLDPGGGDVVHTWSIGALNAATLFSPRTPRVHHALHWPTAADLRRLVRLMNSGGFDLRCGSEALRAHHVAAGLPPGRVGVERPGEILGGLPTPPADHAPADAAPGRAMRPTADAPLTLAAWSDPPRCADATNLTLAALLAGETLQREVRLRLHPAARRTREARQLLAEVGRERVLALDADTMPSRPVAPAVHGLVLAGPPAPLAPHHAAATGLRLIVPRGAGREELLAGVPPERVFWARSASARHLGHQITRLHAALAENAAAPPTASPAPLTSTP